jgi:hypothetical protein
LGVSEPLVKILTGRIQQAPIRDSWDSFVPAVSHLCTGHCNDSNRVGHCIAKFTAGSKNEPEGKEE